MLKMYKQLFKKKLVNLNLSSQELLFKYGIWSDIQIFLINLKNYVKKVLTKKSVCVIIIYVNKKRLEKPTGLQDQ